MDATNIAANFVANKAEVIIRVRGLPFSAKPSEVVSTSNFLLHIPSHLFSPSGNRLDFGTFSNGVLTDQTFQGSAARPQKQ